MKDLLVRTVLPANWRAGLAACREAGVFVTPPVGGFVMVCGRDLAGRADLEADVLPLLAQVSRRFGRAAWFRSDSTNDRFGWALAERGAIVRAYAYDGEHGHVLWVGEVTEAERAIGCFVDDPRDRSDDEVKWWPDRRLVHAMAAHWALDPDRLPELGGAAAVGAIGRL